MSEKPIMPVKLNRAALYFVVLAVLGFVAGSIVPFWSVIGSVFAVIAVLLFLLWWINKRNGRDV